MVGTMIRKKSDSVDSATPVSELSEDTELDKAAFSEILGKIDQGLRALPATAQVALFNPCGFTFAASKMFCAHCPSRKQ